jgi:hypothetical protein
MTDKPDASFRAGMRYAGLLALRRSYSMESGVIPRQEAVSALQEFYEYIDTLANKERIEIT